MTTPPQDTAPAAPLSGRHALITGAGGGIGLAIAHALADAGAVLTLTGRRRVPLERACEQVRASAAGGSGRGEARACLLDVADEASVTAGFEAAAAALGPVDLLINNAGVAESAPLERTTRELWERTLAINLGGVFLCCRAALPAMRERSFGRIVNIASTAGLRGYAYVAAYTAAKHGVIGLTRSLALETARLGVTVNAVCPGYTETEMLARTVANIEATTGRSTEEARAALLRENPQRRFIQPSEIAATVAWLCAPGSESVTGQAIAVAGGEVM